jgi:eukaryotic-like serine/threonine-protein kinase
MPSRGRIALHGAPPFVAGESLRDTLERERQLPVSEAVEIARSVAAALQFANARGIVHRDIKPENILLQAGQPLVADFGVALAVAQAGGGRMTSMGVTVGTAEYMSPEQASGEREIDGRSDVYSLGCVLYEMLTGTAPHRGGSAASVLARALADEPVPVGERRSHIPPHVQVAVHRALEKLPADRFRTAARFADALAGDLSIGHSTPGPFTSRRRERWWQALTATFALLAVLAGTAAVRERLSRPVPQVVRVPLGWLDGEGPVPGAAFALSPDGFHLVYMGPDEALWLRRLDQLQAAKLPGTTGAAEPFFSPDGTQVGFFAEESLRVVSLAGGTVRTLVRDSVDIFGGAWGEDGDIYFSTHGGSIARVRETGGPIEVVSRADTARGDLSYAWMDLLPGGEHALVAILRGSADWSAGVLDLESGRVYPLFPGRQPRFAHPGHLVYGNADGTVEAVPFDPRRLAVTGPPRRILDNVETEFYEGIARFALARNGTLAYKTAGGVPAEELVWVDSTGAATPAAPGWQADFYSLDLSPDGRKVAVTLDSGDREDVWVKALPEGSLLRLTSAHQGTANYRPQWTADGKSLTFISDRSGAGELWMQPADGSAQATLLATDGPLIDEGFLSHDGQWVVYRKGGNVVDSRDIRGLRLAADSAPRVLVASPLDEYSPVLSPDGRWLAYVSVESGRPEVYLRPFPETTGALWLVSVHGGNEPLWSHDGRRLFYRGDRGELMVVDVRAGSTFDGAPPRALFDASRYRANGWYPTYRVSPDGRRFLMIRPVVQANAPRFLVLVLNGFAELTGAARRQP